MALFDLQRLRSSPYLAEVEHHAEIGSTNDRALELSKRDDLRLPLLVLAERQLVGRGRGRNAWWAAEGALTFSLLLDFRELGIPSEHLPQLSLSTGLAICEALERTVPGGDFGVKWPNDVYCGGRKLCGILIETPSVARGRVVVGIGLNVNNSLAAAPSDIQRAATSLVDWLERPLDLTAVLLGLLASLQSRWREFGAEGFARQSLEFRSRCILDGRTLQVSSGARIITGRCLGIDEQGSLILQTESGREEIASGSIISH